jgi:hypothetical protein
VLASCIARSLFWLFQPNREDEYARIEAQGGKVINWNGYRVLGVLAMSRSIGTHPCPLHVMRANVGSSSPEKLQTS